MPYIIRIPSHPDAIARPDTLTAVATLDEARIAVANIYDGVEYADVETAMDNCWSAENLHESGGTVGPLPDGTVIEVAPVTLAELAGSPVANYNPARTADVIATFNARQ